MTRWILLAMAVVGPGCGSSTPTPGDPARKVTWTEYQSMDAEQKDDPYVVDNLDDEANAKVAESQRKKRR